MDYFKNLAFLFHHKLSISSQKNINLWRSPKIDFSHCCIYNTIDKNNSLGFIILFPHGSNKTFIKKN